MGGTIEVKTQKGQGTELTMRLCFQTVLPDERPDPEPETETHTPNPALDFRFFEKMGFPPMVTSFLRFVLPSRA